MTSAEGRITALESELGVDYEARLAAVEELSGKNKAAIESNDQDIAAIMDMLSWKQA